MPTPFDFTKIRKERNKRLGLRAGFDDPITWINTGNYALNKMISGHFDRGVPLGAVTVFAGEPGAGKSYIVSGNIVRDALARGCYVILLDSEDALKETWMRNLGVDVHHPNLTKEVVSTVDEIADCIREFTTSYVESYKETPREQQPKVLFVVDSLGFVQTQAEIDQFTKGELKGDKGIKARMLKLLVANCIRLFSGYEIGLVATNHTYKSQDQFSPDDVISGGVGFIFASSIIVSMNKKKLQNSDNKEAVAQARKEGKKPPPKQIAGITATLKCVKTRYSKPFEEVAVNIPYETGMDPYSGLFDMFDSKGIFAKSGSWYSYTDKSGTEHKQYRKDIGPELYDLIMREWDDTTQAPVGVNELPEIEGALPDEEEVDAE